MTREEFNLALDQVLEEFGRNKFGAQQVRQGIYIFEKQLAALKAENEWQPIETAPKDGSEILLCSKKGRIANGVWMTATDRVGAWLWPYIKVEPTHWMPLPKPPAMAQGEKG